MWELRENHSIPFGTGFSHSRSGATRCFAGSCPPEWPLPVLLHKRDTRGTTPALQDCLFMLQLALYAWTNPRPQFAPVAGPRATENRSVLCTLPMSLRPQPRGEFLRGVRIVTWNPSER